MVPCKVLVAFLLLFGFVAADLEIETSNGKTETDIGISESEKLNSEVVKVNVTRKIFDDENELVETTVIEIKLQVHIVNGIVRVNNISTHHNHVVAIMLLAQISEIKQDAIGRKYRSAPVVVRVMVNEVSLTAGKRLIVQEEIVEIEGHQVTQIDVKEIVMEVNGDNNEVKGKRTITVVAIKESEIHKKPRHEDHFIRDKNLGSELGDPELPKEPYHMDKHGYSICRKFHRLPLLARIAIFGVITLVAVITFLCCIRMFCQKNTKQGEKFEADFDDKIFLDDDDLEAPPLDKKEPLDKQRLLFVA